MSARCFFTLAFTSSVPTLASGASDFFMLVSGYKMIFLVYIEQTFAVEKSRENFGNFEERRRWTIARSDSSAGAYKAGGLPHSFKGNSRVSRDQRGIIALSDQGVIP